MAERGESIVKAFLEEHGFEVKKIPEANKHSIPDFEVYKNGELAFYCEEKTFKEDKRIEKRYKERGLDYYEKYSEDMPLEPSQESMELSCIDDDTFSFRAVAVKQAITQLMAVNKERKYPNALAIINEDSSLGLSDIKVILTGYEYWGSGKWVQIPRVDEGLKKAAENLDLILWFDIDSFRGTVNNFEKIFLRTTSKHYELLERSVNF